MSSFFRRLACLSTVALVIAVPSATAQTAVRVTVTNLAPAKGTALTPVWLGVHDGTFRVFTPGQSSSMALERLAEDGNTSYLENAFGTAGFNRQRTLPGPSGVFLGGESASAMFMLSASNPQHRFLSYASMIVPSNDAFIGSVNPMGRDLTDGNGNFRSFSFFVLGSQVWDAGTEVNDEVPLHTAFFGQQSPNTGVDENGVTSLHAGFNPGGNILSSTRFSEADFTQAGYQIARFDVNVVPEPGTWALMLTGLLALGATARVRRRS